MVSRPCGTQICVTSQVQHRLLPEHDLSFVVTVGNFAMSRPAAVGVHRHLGTCPAEGPSCGADQRHDRGRPVADAEAQGALAGHVADTDEVVDVSGGVAPLLGLALWASPSLVDEVAPPPVEHNVRGGSRQAVEPARQRWTRSSVNAQPLRQCGRDACSTEVRLVGVEGVDEAIKGTRAARHREPSPSTRPGRRARGGAASGVAFVGPVIS